MVMAIAMTAIDTMTMDLHEVHHETNIAPEVAIVRRVVLDHLWDIVLETITVVYLQPQVVVVVEVAVDILAAVDLDLDPHIIVPVVLLAVTKAADQTSIEIVECLLAREDGAQKDTVIVGEVQNGMSIEEMIEDIGLKGED